MSTIKKGRIGYNLLEKELLKRNWDIFLPLLEDNKIDCIICKNHQLIKLQIKTMIKEKNNRYSLPVRKISHNQGEYKVHLYTNDEIDFFIGVNIDTEDVFIVPIDFIMKYKSSISETTLQPYKNNFSLLEPYIENDISAEDDIGESLTANTEGITN